MNNGYRQPPGDEERRAAPSDELVSEEALRTASDSRIAVKFIDGSELNVESLSEVVLSDYLFDPEAASASGTISLNAGLFHFNSNNVTDDNLVLKTPVATIGIRGTQFLVTVADDVTIVDVLEGKVEVSPSGRGKPVLCEGGQSILVAGVDEDAVCGDLGSFSTAAAPPTQQAAAHDSNNKDRSIESADTPSKSGGNPGSPGNPGNPGGGGSPGGGGNPGGPPEGKSNRSGHGDGTNPGKGHGNGNGNHGGSNGGANNPGGGNN